jgi:hypothetical protein
VEYPARKRSTVRCRKSCAGASLRPRKSVHAAVPRRRQRRAPGRRQRRSCSPQYRRGSRAGNPLVRMASRPARRDRPRPRRATVRNPYTHFGLQSCRLARAVAKRLPRSNMQFENQRLEQTRLADEQILRADQAQLERNDVVPIRNLRELSHATFSVSLRRRAICDSRATGEVTQVCSRSDRAMPVLNSTAAMRTGSRHVCTGSLQGARRWVDHNRATSASLANRANDECGVSADTVDHRRRN